jgi:hypothetical protein
MEKLSFSAILPSDFKRLVKIQEASVSTYSWTEVDEILLDDREQQQVREIISHLLNYQTHLMNEATIWSRGIYPLLLLAERGEIMAWAGVPLQATYAQFELEGVADGALAKSVAGLVESPFLVVVEAQKGIEAQNPLFQLYGQILAAARINWETDRRLPQEVFGCYTIADSWTFLRAEVDEIEAQIPVLKVEYSREYVEKLEAEKILKILKAIVSKHIK